MRSASTSRVVTGDYVVTGLWVLLSSVFAELTEWLAETSGYHHELFAQSITILALMAFGPLCAVFGGALFNPVHNAAFLVSGKGSWKLNLSRMGSQLFGAFTGSLAAFFIVPVAFQGKFHKLSGGLKDGVALEAGFLCEAVLGFLLNLVVLYSIETRNRRLGYWTPLLSNIFLTMVGAHYTGPSLNPVVTFSWYWHFQGHTIAEHVAVFWLAPFTGAVAAGLLWPYLLPTRATIHDMLPKKEL